MNTAVEYHLNGPLLVVYVAGHPAPQGSKSAFRNQHTGRIHLKESSKAVAPWRADVKAATEQGIALAGRARFPLDGPLAIDITFTLPKPSSAPKRRRTWPDRRPDLDKLVRSTLDALKAAGAYRDDAQVIQITTCKTYPGEHARALPAPGAALYLSAVTDRPLPDGLSNEDGPVPLDLEGTC